MINGASIMYIGRPKYARLHSWLRQSPKFREFVKCMIPVDVAPQNIRMTILPDSDKIFLSESEKVKICYLSAQKKQSNGKGFTFLWFFNI